MSVVTTISEDQHRIWISSVAGGGLEPPHWPEKYAKSHIFSGFEADFCSKNKNSPPQRDLGAEVVKELPWFGRKNRSNLWFRPKNLSQFRWRLFFFFEDHLFLGRKTVWISNFGRKIRLNFGEDLFFLEITCLWAEKPPQSDSRAMKMWVKVAYSCLNLQKKPPPPFTKSWLRACIGLSIAKGFP